MSVYKRKDDRWQVAYREHGKVRTKTFGKGKAGKKAAEVFAAQVALAKAEDKPLPSRPPGVYLDQLAQEWIDAKKAQGRARQWLADWANILNKYVLDKLDGPVAQMSQGDILTVVNSRWGNSSQCTRNRYIGYLKAIFEQAVEQGHLEKNPLGRWKMGKEPRRKSSLTYEQLRIIQGSSPAHLSWAIECAWHLPIRPVDLFALRFDTHYKPERSGWDVFHKKVGKWSFNHCPDQFMADCEQARKPRKVKAKDELFHMPAYLVEYLGRQVADLGKALSAHSVKMGFGHISFYDLRHCWITTAIDRGVELSTIAYVCGTSVEMLVKNYYQPHAAEQKRASSLMPKMEAKQPSGKVLKIGA